MNEPHKHNVEQEKTGRQTLLSTTCIIPLREPKIDKIIYTFRNQESGNFWKVKTWAHYIEWEA